jgi:ATP-dependent DNA helicase
VSAGPATDKFPVVVTSYEIVIADSKLLQRYKWKYVVVDEGHRLKNFNCKLLRELRQIPVDNKLLLTGVTCPLHPSAVITSVTTWTHFASLDNFVE